ncbi:hypothetical protein DL991_10455 [Amycolatopsis sp. WAC 01375]|uniref:hypothetical protein n=1 Tax=Amycolatopsis sp. WAC 01375 TaxID=2203194 RepID=UPI000F7B278E|nr:hypothetical protein [Amycolatopsis sp. WAC 01375]RSM80530.1 hypothetical protein DL991_10455 [Amycolatopsis sp. WAC 01375]
MTILDIARTRIRAVIDPILTTRHDELPPPDDGTVDPLLTYFQWRGWTIVNRDTHTTAVLSYPASFQGALDTDDRRLAALDDNLQELEVELVLRGNHWNAHFSSCGALIGCARHRSIPLVMGVHALPFTAVLGDLERQARRRQPRDIAHCLLFGACSSQDTPSQPCLLPRVAPDEPAALPVLPGHGRGAE